MDIQKIITSQHNKFKKGAGILHSNRNHQWRSFTTRVTRNCQELIEEGKRQKLFERLYVYNSIEHQQKEYKYKNLHWIAFYWGNHPTPIVDENGTKYLFEKGGSLVFSQNAKGGVVILLNPHRSDIYGRNEDYIITNIYDCPCDISEREIEWAIQDFFAYSQVSSIYGCPSFWDKLIVKCLLFRDVRNRRKVTDYKNQIAFIIKTILTL